MHARRGVRRLLRRGARGAHRGARALGSASWRLAERLAYRPREVVVVALLAGGVFGGLAVERWRARQPAVAARLEAEPPRLTSPAPVQRARGSRPRSPVPRCEESDWTERGPASADPHPPPPRLDLNRATAGELARVARISWRLAARIVAARDAVEGQDSAGAAPAPDDTGAGDAPPPTAPSAEPDPPATGQ
jgi:hypothetical protein